jgi:hypothetical protein
MSHYDMSKFLRATTAGFKINAAKFLSDKEAGWVPVVRATDLEKFLETHTFEKVGDTAELLLRELVQAVDEDGDSGDIVGIANRAAKILGIPTP